MKIIKYALPEPTTTETTLTSDIAYGDTILAVADSSSFSANDFIVLEEIGSEITEIVKIVSIDSATQITLSSGVTIEHISTSKITKINYDKFKITSSTTLDGTYTEVVTQLLYYGQENFKIEYVDDRYEASDGLFYKIYYVNSHTSTETVQDTINNEDNYSYISATQFRAESKITSSLLSDSSLYDALVSGVEYIDDAIYNIFTQTGQVNESIYDIDIGRMHIADKNADREISKEDIVVYEYDATRAVRIFKHHKIVKLISNDAGYKLIFKENMPSSSDRNLIFKIPVTFKAFNSIRHNLLIVNRLIATNYLLINNNNANVKTAVLNWTAGGTNISKDPVTIQAVIETNDKEARSIISEVLSKIYSKKTKLRTTYSSLNHYLGASNNLMLPSARQRRW